MSKPVDAEALTGCVSAIWTLAVTGPMWLFLLYGILTTINAPNHMWILFWCYVPANIVGCTLISIFKALCTSKPQ